MGRKLIEGTLPNIANQLERIANALESKELKNLIDFLEYEEALTTDKSTATRIRVLLKTMKVWN